jgi:hypothetical protein
MVKLLPLGQDTIIKNVENFPLQKDDVLNGHSRDQGVCFRLVLLFLKAFLSDKDANNN